MRQIDFSRLTAGRSLTDLLPDGAQLRVWVRAAPAVLAGADGIALVVLAGRHDWWDFASMTAVSAAFGVPWLAYKGLTLFSRYEDARTRRAVAETTEARERQKTAKLELEVVGRQAGARTSVSREPEVEAAAGRRPSPSGRPRRRRPPALPVPVAAPAVLDYEIDGLLPPDAEIGWVYQDAAGTNLVVIASPDGHRLARLNDMQLIRRDDVVPPLSVSGGVEVNILPLESDTTHATTGKAIHD